GGAVELLRDGGSGRGPRAPRRRAPRAARPPRRADIDLLSGDPRVRRLPGPLRRAGAPAHRVRRARGDHDPAVPRHGRGSAGPGGRRAGRGARGVSWTLPLTDVILDDEEVEAVAECLRSGWLTMGPRTQRLEAEMASWTGSPLAVAVSSGTAALHLSCSALGL